uniref:Uncharacterized protein n=1 Tax=Globodera rostochiensis TaxID=31243 RepID=A0A914HU43_GLORO
MASSSSSSSAPSIFCTSNSTSPSATPLVNAMDDGRIGWIGRNGAKRDVKDDATRAKGSCASSTANQKDR